MLDELCGGDESAACSLAEQVWVRLTEGEGAATAADEADGLPVKLDKAVRIGTGGIPPAGGDKSRQGAAVWAAPRRAGRRRRGAR